MKKILAVLAFSAFASAQSAGVGSAPDAAFLQSFFVIAREGLEAILILAAVIAYLRASHHEKKLPSVYAGAVWKLYIVNWIFWLAVIAVALFLLWKFAWPSVSAAMGSIPGFSRAPPSAGRKKVEESEFNFGGWFLLLVLGIGVLCFFALLAFVGSRFGWAEGLVAGILFIGFSIVLVPVSLFMTMVIAQMLFSPVIYSSGGMMVD